MKRDQQHRPEGIVRVWPMLSWVLCKKCGKEFRMENGWAKQIGPWVGNRGLTVCVCAACCPTAEEAEVVFSAKPPPTPLPSGCREDEKPTEVQLLEHRVKTLKDTLRMIATVRLKDTSEGESRNASAYALIKSRNTARAALNMPFQRWEDLVGERLP